jgi:hypothetical protein
MAGVIAANLLLAGLRTEFVDTMKTDYKAIVQEYAPVMRLGIPSDKAVEYYAYPESAPYPKRWPRGTTPTSEGFDARQWSTVNFDWVSRVDWHENDREDDQTSSLYDQARDAGGLWASIPERVFFQIITGATDPDLLPVVPTAPDGVAIWSATDGTGADRFGVSGGNIIAAADVAGGDANIQANYFNAIERLRGFKNTKNQPYWNPRTLDKGFVLFFSHTRTQEYLSAFKNMRTVKIITNQAGSENVAAVTPSNVILESGQQVELRPTTYITDDDAFLFAIGSSKRAVYQQTRRQVRETNATMENSDKVRDTKEEYIQWDSREGYGVGLPIMAVKLDR